MRRLAASLAVLGATIGLGACGNGSHHPVQQSARVPVLFQTEPPARSDAAQKIASGHGSMGITRPPSAIPPSGGILPFAQQSGPRFIDRSNNDPIRNLGQWQALRRQGIQLTINKVNQGCGFTDQTFVPMARLAHRAGLSVSGYVFAQDYTKAEAQCFVSLLHRAGMHSVGSGWGVPVLDVEYGSATRVGVTRLLNVVVAAFHRVAIYTGCWYWSPHLGGFWPAQAVGWLSGYPNAVTCGQGSHYLAHQYTDHGALSGDESVWLGHGSTYASFAGISHGGHSTPTHHAKPKPHHKHHRRAKKHHRPHRHHRHH